MCRVIIEAMSRAELENYREQTNGFVKDGFLHWAKELDRIDAELKVRVENGEEL